MPSSDYEEIRGKVTDVVAFIWIEHEDGSETVLDISSPVGDEYSDCIIKATASRMHDGWGRRRVESLHDIVTLTDADGNPL